MRTPLVLLPVLTLICACQAQLDSSASLDAPEDEGVAGEVAGDGALGEAGGEGDSPPGAEGEGEGRPPERGEEPFKYPLPD